MNYIENKSVSYCLSIIILTVTAYFSYQVLQFVALAPELSDSAFYILNNQKPSEIEILLSGFGVLSKAFFLPENIIYARIANFALILLCPSILLFAFMRVTSRFHIVSWINLSLVAGIGNLAVYRNFLLDLNYNNLLIPLYYFTLSAAFYLLDYLTSSQNRLKHRQIIFIAGIFGFLCVSMAYTKITSFAAFSALVILPSLLISLFFSERNPQEITSSIIVITTGFILGVVLWFVFIWLRVMSPTEIITKFINGYNALEILDAHNEVFGGKFHRAMSIFTNSMVLIFPLTVIMIHPIAIYFSRVEEQTKTTIKTQFLSGFFSIVPLLLFLLPIPLLLSLPSDFGSLRYFLIFPLVDGTIMHVALFQIILFIAAFMWRVETSKTYIWLILIILLLAPLSLSFGTNNLLTKHFTIYFGLQISVLVLMASYSEKFRNYLTILALCLALLVTFFALQQAHRKPYRIMSSIEDANVRIEALGQQFYGSKIIAKSYEDIDNLIATNAYQNSPPSSILFDLSGRVPLIYLLTDFTFPGTVWTLAGYKGSEDYFLHALDNFVMDEELKNAWLLIDRPDEDGERFGISIDTLNHRLNEAGLEFPEDYKQVGEFFIGYKAIYADIYAPKYLVNDISSR